VDDPLDLAVIEMVNEAMPAYEYAPASEAKLATPFEILEAIKGLDWQGSGPERYSEQGPETSSKARDKLSLESV
jgi:hypothetical protein